MTPELTSFAVRLRQSIASGTGIEFDSLALELFGLQFQFNGAYRRICDARKVTPANISDWTRIPAVPAAAFKELELTSLPPEERTAVFHSSGTTGQSPSRHFHCAESLRLYEASLWAWFQKHCLLDRAGDGSRASSPVSPNVQVRLLALTPPRTQAPHSSLVHMFESIGCQPGVRLQFLGQVGSDGAWLLDLLDVVEALQAAVTVNEPLVLLGTAFNYVHLLDGLATRNLCVRLPSGSVVMETGGYKGRSRELARPELHALITDRLGIPASHIICEYGMSEISSQAYDGVAGLPRNTQHATRVFTFPPWCRAQLLSPETGREVADGETGLIRLFDLANVFSVMALQTEDLGVRRGDGFELIGRAVTAEPRGCSLMAS